MQPIDGGLGEERVGHLSEHLGGVPVARHEGRRGLGPVRSGGQ